SDPAFLPGITASFQALGFATDGGDRGLPINIEEFPLGAIDGQAKVEKLLEDYSDAVAGVFIEKPGPNEQGVFHTSSGKAKDSQSVAHLHLLAEALNASDCVT